MSAGGPNFGRSVGRLFGDHKQFSATLELEAHDGRAGDTTLPGRLSYSDGKSRFEMDMSKMKNSNMPPGAADQMKAMGMAQMVVIARPDKKLNYMVYPDLKAYAEMPAPDSETPEAVAKYQMQATELGKETVDGHPCVKNKVVVTDGQGKTHESTVWNATDLKDFPVKIEMVERNTRVVMNFKDIKLAKPEAKIFDAPDGLKKYDNVMTLMQTEMMKRMGEQGGFPPAEK